jgi:Xaa-Pro aminopeptidase
LVCSRGGGTLDRYGDVLYLTNFYSPFPYIPDLPGQWSARAHSFFLLPVDHDPLLVMDMPGDGQVSLPDSCMLQTDLVLEETLSGMTRLGLDRGPVGLVGGDVLPATSYRALAAALPNVQWQDAQSILACLRSVKSPGEIALLRRSADVGSRTMEAIMDAAHPGATHGEIVAAGQGVLNTAGGILYNSFMASGRGGEVPEAYRASFPTWSNPKPLEEGQWLRLGISGVVEGYVFDISRSRAIGQASNRQIALFEGAIEVVEAGIEAIRPGTTAAEVAAAGRAKQSALGFPLKGVFSGLGHGLGLGWDAPWLAPGDETPIAPGMVINVEKTLAQDGYVGDYEETVLVTETGLERLTSAQRRYW